MNDSQNTSKKTFKPKARVAKGFRDIDAAEIRGIRAMLATIQDVYESYGFEPVEQPFIEYTEALGKFLPDQDRPNAGVFSFQDDDDQWLSLRYDLTAPLARYVAENNQGQLPTPYRSYRQGWVFRNEKPGPGRYRQFMQFDADTVGSANPAADAEVCMMAADTMEALGLERGSYRIIVNNRKILDGIMQSIGLGGRDETARKLTVMRAMDKFDRLGEDGTKSLLGEGRKDESGDFTVGAKLEVHQVDKLIALLQFGNTNASYQSENSIPGLRFFPNPFTKPPIQWNSEDNANLEFLEVQRATFQPLNPDNKIYTPSAGIEVLSDLAQIFGDDLNEQLVSGIRELAEMQELFVSAGYEPRQIAINSNITPDPCSNANSSWTPRTRTATPCALALLVVVGVMMIWWRGLRVRKCQPRAFPLACRGFIQR
jgi:phenylalanyl-tRNA synthetase alpha subunit